MLRRFLNGKIRDIRITGTYVDYEGSIKLDEAYIEKAGMVPWEEVQILNFENKERFTTYIIKGERGSGVVELNGPAALLGKVGDRIMVLTYANLSPDEIPKHTPKIVRVGKDV